MAGFITASRAEEADHASETDKVVAPNYEAGKDILGDGLDGQLVKDDGGTVQFEIGQEASQGRTQINEDGQVQEMKDKNTDMVKNSVAQTIITKKAGFLDRDSTDGYSYVINDWSFTVPDNKQWVPIVVTTGISEASFSTGDSYIKSYIYHFGGRWRDGSNTLLSSAQLTPGSYSNYDLRVDHYSYIETEDGGQLTIAVPCVWQVIEIPYSS